MRISYDWLRELVDTAMTPETLGLTLTNKGLAVDALDRMGNDYVFEIDLTANRPDCLSHAGVAREIAVAENKQLRLPQPRVNNGKSCSEHFSLIKVEAYDMCPLYSAWAISDVTIGPSPEWMTKRLAAVGLRSINNVADITNYVMLELGQPLHAFDLAQLHGKTILVRRARKGEGIITLDAVERQLDAGMLVIADGNRPVAIAGVMGGEGSQISLQTRDVLIESAWFDPATVRSTSARLNLQTDSSYRFERGVDHEGVLRAQSRAVELISEIAGGVPAEKPMKVQVGSFESKSVSLRPERIKKLTGLDVPREEVIRILTGLGFREEGTSGAGDEEIHPHYAGDDQFSPADRMGEFAVSRFAVPSWRFDVSLEEDLIEEVARQFGYDRIVPQVPGGRSSGHYLRGESGRRATRRALVSLGYDEAVTFSFIKPESAVAFEPLPGLLPEGHGKGLVELTNPIIEGASVMRPTLVPGLLQVVKNNFNQNTRDVRIFEVGRVFGDALDSGRPNERESLGLAISGGLLASGYLELQRSLNFFDLKGAVEAVAEALKIGPLSFSGVLVKHLREGQAAQVMLDGRRVGLLGRVSDEVSEENKFRQPVYVAELDLTEMLDAVRTPVRYQPLSRYPAVARDVTLVGDRNIPYGQIHQAIAEMNLEHLERIGLVGIFEDRDLPAGARSITLRLEFRSPDRTLRDENVDQGQKHVLEALAKRFGMELRK